MQKMIFSEGNSDLPEIALTFDDGPDPRYTPQVLSILRQYNVHATFFMLGERVEAYPSLVQQAYAEGNTIGNHSWNHPNLTTLTADDVHTQLRNTSTAIRAATGVEPIFFRPPYGAYNYQIASQASSLGLTTVTWSVDTSDWQQPGSSAIVDTVLTHSQNGSVILMHDGGGERSQTIEALPTVIRKLQEKGFRLVTLQQLVDDSQSAHRHTSPSVTMTTRKEGAHMSIGVVIPTYNRRDSLVYTLQSLAGQTNQNFHVVVVDDGSTDGTRTMIEQLMQQATWQGRLRWIGCGPNHGHRAGRARNVGAANLAQECTFMIMLDSDIIVSPTVIERYAQTHARYPTTVIMGTIEWLPPLERSDLSQLFEQGVDALRLKRLKVPTTPRRIKGTFVGPDFRGWHLQRSSDALHPISPELGWTGNVGYPLSVFRELEGFDEAIRGYGYDDVELGVRAHKQGIQSLFDTGMWSLHIWHPKVDWERMRTEEQSNLDYVLRKHGPIEHLERLCDWSYWRHYHRLRGGQLVSREQQLWAINLRGTQRLSLPSLDWIERLGFCSLEEVKPVEAAQLAHIPIAGICYW
jgi:peptidoglycan/xylan/chitin deacetylase (PgdA/CDA1 family)/GT2 family glycosyltransferase